MAQCHEGPWTIHRALAEWWWIDTDDIDRIDTDDVDRIDIDDTDRIDTDGDDVDGASIWLSGHITVLLSSCTNLHRNFVVCRPCSSELP